MERVSSSSVAKWKHNNDYIQIHLVECSSFIFVLRQKSIIAVMLFRILSSFVIVMLETLYACSTTGYLSLHCTILNPFFWYLWVKHIIMCCSSSFNQEIKSTFLIFRMDNKINFVVNICQSVKMWIRDLNCKKQVTKAENIHTEARMQTTNKCGFLIYYRCCSVSIVLRLKIYHFKKHEIFAFQKRKMHSK